jgi:hypothetical protein
MISAVVRRPHMHVCHMYIAKCLQIARSDVIRRPRFHMFGPDLVKGLDGGCLQGLTGAAEVYNINT